MMTTEQLETWIDRHAIDPTGHKVGTIADVYIDDATGEPEWLAIMTGLFGQRMSFAPLADATEDGDDIRIAYDKALVKDAPNIDADGQLSEEEEQRLYRHYGMTYRGGATGADTIHLDQDMAETGSTTVSAEISPEVAVTRLRKRDQQAVESIGLDADDLDVTDAVDLTEQRSHH